MIYIYVWYDTCMYHNIRIDVQYNNDHHILSYIIIHFSPADLAQLRKEHAVGQLYARQSIEGARGTSNAYCVLDVLVDDG